MGQRKSAPWVNLASAPTNALSLQIPADAHRAHYVKTKINVHRYEEGTLAIFHGPRCLARYDALGKVPQLKLKRAA